MSSDPRCGTHQSQKDRSRVILCSFVSRAATVELLNPVLKSYTSCYATNLRVETIFLRKDYQVLLIISLCMIKSKFRKKFIINSGLCKNETFQRSKVFFSLERSSTRFEIGHYVHIESTFPFVDRFFPLPLENPQQGKMGRRVFARAYTFTCRAVETFAISDTIMAPPSNFDRVPTPFFTVCSS